MLQLSCVVRSVIIILVKTKIIIFICRLFRAAAGFFANTDPYLTVKALVCLIFSHIFFIKAQYLFKLCIFFNYFVHFKIFLIILVLTLIIVNNILKIYYFNILTKIFYISEWGNFYAVLPLYR